MGWIALAGFGLAAFVALRLAGVPGRLGTIVAAALMLGAAGYAWQQRAGLPGSPVTAAARAVDVDPGLIAFRAAILPMTDADARQFDIADGQLRAGATEDAVDTMLRAVAAKPRDPALWTGLGGVLAAHQGAAMSPAALYAFRRAWQLAPQQPGPPFFLGLAYVQAGDLDAARTAWIRALQLTPREAPWRVDIAERLVLIDQFQAMLAGAGKPPR